jgi:2-amino-4-hydroxy-6-hydroxymethyldihydropteridine diphosphokinase
MRVNTMNTALVMIGSNMDADKHLPLVLHKMASDFTIEMTSNCITSEPIGEKYKSPFYNKAVRITSSLSLECTILKFKEIEKELGRTPDSKKSGLIPIDIDLIFWNEQQVHQDYDRFSFVKTCIDEIKH